MNSIFFSVVFFAAGAGQLVEPPAAPRVDAQVLERNLQEVDQRLKHLRSLIGPGQPSTTPNEQLMTLESVVTELELDVLGKEALWKQLQSIPPAQFPMTPELQANLANDPKLAAYRRELSELEDGVRRIQEQLGDEHAGVRQDKDLVERARKRVDAETAVKKLTLANQQIAQAQQGYLRSQEMLLKAKDQLMRARAEQRVRDTNLAEYIRLLKSRKDLMAKMPGSQQTQILPDSSQKTNLVELQQAVERAKAALEQAKAAHGKAVFELEEAMAATQPAGSADGLDSGNQAESRPVRESGN